MGSVADLRGHGVVAVLHRPSGGVDADHQRGVELEIHLLPHLLDGLPAVLGIGNGARAAHERDAAVAERVQVGQRLFHGAVMVENDIGHVRSPRCG
jgi:hypothetical protein